MERTRRLRMNERVRDMVRENHVRVDELIYPIFVIEGENICEPVESMPASASIRLTDFMKNLTECVRQGFRQFYCLVFRHTKMSREVVRMPKMESCHRRFAILRKITKNLLLLRMSACVNTHHMDTAV